MEVGAPPMDAPETVFTSMWVCSENSRESTRYAAEKPPELITLSSEASDNGVPANNRMKSFSANSFMLILSLSPDYT